MAVRAITPQQSKFVAEYLVSNNAKAAATAAGYSPSIAERASDRLLKKPQIQAEIKKSRTVIREKAEWTLERMVGEAEKALDFAYVRNHPVAVNQAVVNLAKLTGLLDERPVNVVDLGAILDAARKRVALQPIDVPHREVLPAPAGGAITAESIFED